MSSNGASGTAARRISSVTAATLSASLKTATKTEKRGSVVGLAGDVIGLARGMRSCGGNIDHSAKPGTHFQRGATPCPRMQALHPPDAIGPRYAGLGPLRAELAPRRGQYLAFADVVGGADDAFGLHLF